MGVKFGGDAENNGNNILLMYNVWEATAVTWYDQLGGLESKGNG